MFWSYRVINECYLFISSGKSFTLKGESGSEKGCIFRGIEDLFNLVNVSRQSSTSSKYEIGISIYHIYKDKIVDLLDEYIDNSQKQYSINGLSLKFLKNAYDCQTFLNEANKHVKLMCKEELNKDINVGAHMIALVTLFKQQKGGKQVVSRIQFAELASSEQAFEKNEYK